MKYFEGDASDDNFVPAKDYPVHVAPGATSKERTRLPAGWKTTEGTADKRQRELLAEYLEQRKAGIKPPKEKPYWKKKRDERKAGK
jgi:hypothetical protein